jgi:hypothetical protein
MLYDLLYCLLLFPSQYRILKVWRIRDQFELTAVILPGLIITNQIVDVCSCFNDVVEGRRVDN